MRPSALVAAAVALCAGFVGWWSSWQLSPPRRPWSPSDAEPPGQGRRRPSRPAGDPGDEPGLASWCEHVASRVRTGASLPSAFADACQRVPAGAGVFAPALQAQRRGSTLSTALGRVTGRSDAARLVTATVRTCARLGGPAAEPLDRVAATLHGRAAARAERRVHSAQAELSAKVLTALPIAVLILLVVTDGDVRGALSHPVAQLCVGIGLVLNVAGWWWMRRIVATQPRRRLGRPARRARDEAARALPEGIELLVACLRAGLTPTQLVEGVLDDLPPPLRPAFDAVLSRMHRGQRFADAVTELPAHLGPGAHGLADSMAAAERYGLALGPILDRLAAEASESRRRQGEADARRLPVRLSFPLVVATLPSFVLVAIAPAVIGAVSSLRVTAA